MPKRTKQNNPRKQSDTHGFRVRAKAQKNGESKVLKNRRAKGRVALAK